MLCERVYVFCCVCANEFCAITPQQLDQYATTCCDILRPNPILEHVDKSDNRGWLHDAISALYECTLLTVTANSMLKMHALGNKGEFLNNFNTYTVFLRWSNSSFFALWYARFLMIIIIWQQGIPNRLCIEEMTITPWISVDIVPVCRCDKMRVMFFVSVSGTLCVCVRLCKREKV